MHHVPYHMQSSAFSSDCIRWSQINDPCGFAVSFHSCIHCTVVPAKMQAAFNSSCFTGTGTGGGCGDGAKRAEAKGAGCSL